MKRTEFTLALSLLMGFISVAAAEESSPRPQKDQAAMPTIVLVHGAFADGSSFQRVIPLLQNDGYTVVAVQIPLTSLAEDIATTQRALDAQKGSVLLVGHSYGGAVITGAAVGHPQVKALVYLAAFAPDAGESINALTAKFKPSALGPALVPYGTGFLAIDPSKFHATFAADVPAREARVAAATQKPIAAAAFGETLDAAAWKTLPSWYLVSQEDQAINPDLERFMAQRIGAKTTEIKASHVAFISHPQTVARLIEAAAKASAQ